MPSVLFRTPVPPAITQPHNMMLPPSFYYKHCSGHSGQFCFARSEDVSPGCNVFLQSSGSCSLTFPAFWHTFGILILFYLFPSVSSQGPWLLVSGIDLHFYDQVFFIYRRRMQISFQSVMRAAWSHGVHTCVLVFVPMINVPSSI